jgi:GAF domain-containing protein
MDEILDRATLTVAKLLRQQAALAAFGTFAFRETDLQKILTEAARVCADSLNVPFCKICRYRPNENDLMIIAGCGWKPNVIGSVVSEANETTPQGRAYLTRGPVVIPNIYRDNELALPQFLPRAWDRPDDRRCDQQHHRCCLLRRWKSIARSRPATTTTISTS